VGRRLAGVVILQRSPDDPNLWTFRWAQEVR